MTLRISYLICENPLTFLSHTKTLKYQIIVYCYFQPMLFSPFYTCKRIIPSWIRPDAIVLNEVLFARLKFAQSSICNLTTKTKRTKISEGEYYPAYSYIIKENINVGLRMHLSFVRLLNLMGTLWTLLYLLKYHRGLRVVTVEKCATLGVRFNILH